MHLKWKNPTPLRRISPSASLAAALLLTPALASAGSALGIERAAMLGGLDARGALTGDATELPVSLGDQSGSSMSALVETTRGATPFTIVDFEIDRTREMRLEVRDLDGRLVRTIAEGRWATGIHRLAWQHDTDGGAPAAVGIYVLKLVPVRGQTVVPAR